MKLNKIHIKDFRFIKDLELELGDRITLIIGESGSGKSSVLDYLNFIGAGSYWYHKTGLIKNDMALIDNIDANLHPMVQVNVLNELIENNPDVQFVVTTHSPLILSNLKPAYVPRVYRMCIDDDGNNTAFEISDGIGKSYEYNLSENFDVEPIPTILQNMQDDIYYYKAKGNIEKLKEVYASLQEYYRSDKLPSEFEKQFDILKEHEQK